MDSDRSSDFESEQELSIDRNYENLNYIPSLSYLKDFFFSEFECINYLYEKQIFVDPCSVQKILGKI